MTIIQSQTVFKFFGHLLKYSDNIKSMVDSAENKYIDTVLKDLKIRFEGLNKDTVNLKIFYDLSNLDANLETATEALGKLYKIDSTSILTEIPNSTIK